MSLRHMVAASLAFGVTFGLFYVMQALISMSEGGLDESGRHRIVEFIRLKRDTDLELKKREMPDKKLPPKPPPMPDLNLSTSPLPDQALGMGFGAGLELEMDGGPNLGAAASDADVVPVVRVNPQYPLRAAQRGIEGWVELEFTITTAGTVREPVVLASHPGRTFDRAAIQAISKWKYNPKIDDGKPVERPGVRVRLRFQLDD